MQLHKQEHATADAHANPNDMLRLVVSGSVTISNVRSINRSSSDELIKFTLSFLYDVVVVVVEIFRASLIHIYLMSHER